MPAPPPRTAGSAFPVGPDLVARVRTTDRRDGDLAVDGDPVALGARRSEILDRPWVWLRQVHGATVVALDDDAPVDALVGSEADAVVTRRTDVVLAAHSADCATVALVGTVPARPATLVAGRPDLAEAACIGVVHAGWRGLRAGVVGAAVGALRDLGAESVRAELGPCIGPECYEFGEPELRDLAERWGPSVVGSTLEGRPALDLRAGIRAALAEAVVEVVTTSVPCTACGATTDAAAPDARCADGPRWYSHRARGDEGRQALLVWLDRTSANQPR